ncbi:MAG TPA: zinc-binding alcohol dehydrogenase family protein [Solirubrobacteraceae bacterium]|nr:zinc-binding alcohol dehydrogenase family protein [Solirubrobacteraceae bacterium]
MMAVVVRDADTPPAFEEFDDPRAGEGQFVVDVLAAGLNPVDLAMIGSGALPAVPGNEGVARTPGGGRAYFERTIAPFGSFAQRALVAAELPIALPDELSTADALAIGIAGLAGWLALDRAAALRPGESVLVLGASGAVGQIAVQAARLLGASRVVAAAREPCAVEDLGADAIVELTGDYPAALRDAAGDGFDVVIDPLFGKPLEAALTASAPGARLVSVGASAGATAEIERSGLVGRTLLTHGNRTTPVDVKREAYLRMCGHVLAGELSVVSEEVPLERFAEAFARQRAHPHVKLVLTNPKPGGTP